MKLLLYFYRDEQGRPRLFHAHDEIEAQQAAILRWEVPSLVADMAKLRDEKAYEGPIAAIMVDTDNRILAEPANVDHVSLPEQDALAAVLGPKMVSVDFETLLPR